jgi:hypothetical protein
MANSFTAAEIIERLEVLRHKLEDEGRYVSANTVTLAIERLEELSHESVVENNQSDRELIAKYGAMLLRAEAERDTIREENVRLLELVNFYRDAFPTDAAMAQRNLGRPRIEDAANSFEATKPWLELGWSRSTWYRRQAEKRKGQAL